MDYGNVPETQQPEPDRVQFGPGDTDTMPVAWASLALTWLKRTQPHIFGQMMTEGVWGIEKARRNGRRV